MEDESRALLREALRVLEWRNPRNKDRIGSKTCLCCGKNYPAYPGHAKGCLIRRIEEHLAKEVS